MVSWVPYAPASCSTRGKPFPAGAWQAGAGQWVGAVRCGARYWAGPVSQAGPALVCRVNRQGQLEQHREFWVLVGGDELDWADPAPNLANTVRVVGAEGAVGRAGPQVTLEY